MKKKPCILENSRGFSLIEMVIIVAIITIVASIATVSYGTLQARVRYSQIRTTMRSIIDAAMIDYAGSRNNTWALNVPPGSAPSFIGPVLTIWPIPPCQDWFYSWENYSAVPAMKSVRLTIHNKTGAALWSYCLQSYGPDCMADDGTGAPINLATLPSSAKFIYCNE